MLYLSSSSAWYQCDGLHKVRKHTTHNATIHSSLPRIQSSSSSLQPRLRGILRILIRRPRSRGRRIHESIAGNHTRLAIRSRRSKQQDAANLASIGCIRSQDGATLLIGASEHLAQSRCEGHGRCNDGALAGGVGRGEDDGGLSLGGYLGGALLIDAGCGHGDRGGGLAEDGARDGRSLALLIGRSSDGYGDHDGWAAGRRGGGALLSRFLGRRGTVRRRVLPLHLQVLHRCYDELGRERRVLLMYALDAVAVRFEDTIAEVVEAVQSRVQRLFWQGIKQVLERFVRIGIEGLHIPVRLLGRRRGILAGYTAKERQCQQGELVERTHGGLCKAGGVESESESVVWCVGICPAREAAKEFLAAGGWLD